MSNELDLIAVDAIAKCVPSEQLFTSNSLKLLHSKLSDFDVVSLLYLMCEGNKDTSELFEVLSSAVVGNSIKTLDFTYICERYVSNWKGKIIEGLVEIEHFSGLLEVFNVNKLDAVYNVKMGDGILNTNKVKIRAICERLDKKNKKVFLNALKETAKIRQPMLAGVHLELYFMWWEVTGEITSSGYGFDKLAHAVESIGVDGLMDVLTPAGHNPLPKLSEDDYNLSEYPIVDENNVGLAVIVNQFDFEDSENNRAASCLDETFLTTVLNSLKFDVVAMQNLKSWELVESIHTTVRSKFEGKHSILFMTVMSHGQDGSVMGTDGKFVEMKEIIAALHSVETLSKIPKVLVINACRGDQLFGTRSKGIYEADLSVQHKKIRSDIMDLIICYSTIPGFVSIRNQIKGSLFVQVLCEVLEKRAELEICEIFTLVNRALMNPKDFRAYNPSKLAHPCEYNSRLLRKLYLKKKT